MSQSATPRTATLADLQKILDHAKHSPGERERLTQNAAAVLQSNNLVASAEAVEFLKSMGSKPYKPGTTTPKARDASTGMGET